MFTDSSPPFSQPRCFLLPVGSAGSDQQHRGDGVSLTKQHAWADEPPRRRVGSTYALGAAPISCGGAWIGKPGH